MIVYKDKVTGDELYSDAYSMEVVDDFFYKVRAKITTRKSGVEGLNIGANPSAEEQEEGLDENETSGCSIVLDFKLNETSFDKKSYSAYIKGYMKTLSSKIKEDQGEEAENDFKQRAQAGVKKILSKFNDWQFFLGESQNPEGMVALLDFEEDGVTPYMMFLKDGLIAEKF